MEKIDDDQSLEPIRFKREKKTATELKLMGACAVRFPLF